MTKGERIKVAREHVGMNQVTLADRIGVSKQTMYKYENDIITNIPSDKIESIAELTGTTPAFLMGWDEPEKYQSEYYIDKDARNIAEFLHKTPEYKVLFDASRKVKPEDIKFVKELIDRVNGE